MTLVVVMGRVTWAVCRAALGAVLVMLEPLLRIVLLPVAFGSFFVTLLFGFMMNDPRFPKWGMLAFSVGALWVYWLFLAVMLWVMGAGRGRR
jgi:hypothetical protein